MCSWLIGGVNQPNWIEVKLIRNSKIESKETLQFVKFENPSIKKENKIRNLFLNNLQYTLNLLNI